MVTNAETAASTPVACTVTAIGFRNQKQVATQSVDFNPGGLLGVASLSANMVKAQLSSQFANVDRVEFSANDLLASTLDAVLMDNFAYDVYVKKGESVQY